MFEIRQRIVRCPSYLFLCWKSPHHRQEYIATRNTRFRFQKTEVLNLVSGCFGAELSLKRFAHTASVSEDSSILAGQIITTKPPGTVTFYEGNPPRVSRAPRLPGFTLEPPNTGADRMTVREYTREKPLNAGLGIYTVWLYWVFPEMVGKISQIIHFSLGFP